MAVEKARTGQVTPFTSVADFTPRGRKDRPHTPYGERGLNVWLRPIPGVSDPRQFPHNKTFAFQVPPLDVFGLDGDAPHDDYMTIGDGEHSSPGSGPNLRTLSYNTLFVDYQANWSLLHHANWVPDPQEYIADLGRIRTLRKPFHLLVHQSNLRDKYDVDMAATLRSVHWEIRHGENDAYYVTVSFKEFRSPDIQEFLVGAAHHPHLPARIPVARIPANRNTLAKMARFYYGDPSKWRSIAAANGIRNVTSNTVLTAKNVHKTAVSVPVLKKPSTKKGQRR